jgi:hypothetical protein
MLHVIQKVVIFNGPPRSGKDTICDHLYKQFPQHIIRTRFAESLKLGCHALLGLQNTTAEEFNDVKDEPQELLGGRTWRQVYIHIAERGLKDFFDKELFGRVMLNSLRHKLAEKAFIQHGSYGSDPDRQVVVISDCGFVEEIQPLIRYFTPDRLVLIRIHRRGFDYGLDSRGYIVDPKIEHQFDVVNPEGQVERFFHSVMQRLEMAGVLQYL